jgi:hypothetical protein
MFVIRRIEIIYHTKVSNFFIYYSSFFNFILFICEKKKNLIEKHNIKKKHVKIVNSLSKTINV